MSTGRGGRGRREGSEAVACLHPTGKGDMRTLSLGRLHPGMVGWVEEGREKGLCVHFQPPFSLLKRAESAAPNEHNSLTVLNFVPCCKCLCVQYGQAEGECCSAAGDVDPYLRIVCLKLFG